jgi:hypothetical protein
MGNAGIRHLFPWGTADRATVFQELRALVSWRLPTSGPGSRLPGFVHGLGLLAVTAMALTGSILVFGLPASGAEPVRFVDTTKELHEAISNFIEFTGAAMWPWRCCTNG